MSGTEDHGAAVGRRTEPVRAEVRHLPHDPATGDCPGARPGAREEAAVDKDPDDGETDTGRGDGPGAQGLRERWGAGAAGPAARGTGSLWPRPGCLALSFGRTREGTERSAQTVLSAGATRASAPISSAVHRAPSGPG